MSHSFDPYYKWLAIPKKDQPPNRYRLLGLDLFEDDPEVIEAAANRQMTYVQGCAEGKHVRESQQLLNEIAQARLCLLDANRKKVYDEGLRKTLAEKENGAGGASNGRKTRSARSRRGDPEEVAAPPAAPPQPTVSALYMNARRTPPSGLPTPSSSGGVSTRAASSRSTLLTRRRRQAQRVPLILGIGGVIAAILLVAGLFVILNTGEAPAPAAQANGQSRQQEPQEPSAPLPDVPLPDVVAPDDYEDEGGTNSAGEEPAPEALAANNDNGEPQAPAAPESGSEPDVDTNESETSSNGSETTATSVERPGGSGDPAETNEPSEPKPRAPQQDKKPSHRKPDSRPKPETPVDPFKDLPKVVTLPAAPAKLEQMTPFPLGRVAIPGNERCYLSLVGGETAYRGAQSFAVSDGDQTQWDVELRVRDETDVTKIAQIRLEDSQLVFAWVAGAIDSSPKIADHLRNCLLEVRIASPEPHLVRLRNFEEVEPLAIDPTKPASRAVVDLESPPQEESIRVELTGLELGGEEPIPFKIEVPLLVAAEPSETSISLGEGVPLVFVRVATKMSRSGLQIEAAPEFRKDNRAIPLAQAAAYFKGLSVSVNQVWPAEINRIKELAKKQKGPQKERLEALQKAREKTLSEAKAAVEQWGAVSEIVRALREGAKLHFRVFFETQAGPVGLAETSMPESAKKRGAKDGDGGKKPKDEAEKPADKGARKPDAQDAKAKPRDEK